jgi:hypothetical protein
MTATGVVLLVAVVVIIATVVLLAGRRPQARVRSGWLASRERQVKDAAAEDVAAIREDAKDVSPDAPGNHTDDL